MTTVPSRPSRGEGDVRVVLLGTAGGPPLWPESDRAGCATALAVGPHVYLVDMGEGWRLRLRESGLARRRYPGALGNVRAAFITHLHSDHVVDYPNLLIMGVTDGRREDPIRVLGPAGTVAMTNSIVDAFDADLRDRTREGRNPPPREVVDAQDILVPSAATRPVDAWTTPVIEPFRVYEDEAIRVTATLAAHPPLTPCFAFRFETEHGAIVFSGDTAPHDNIRRLSDGADILVHEAVDADWAQRTLGSTGSKQLLEHFLRSHTSAQDAAVVAAEAGVKRLVLQHLVPATLPDARWRELAGGFGADRLHVGRDLDVIVLGGMG